MLNNQFIAIALLCMLNAIPAGADELAQDRIRQLQQSGQILPLEKILLKANQYRAGRFLESELEVDKLGRYIYEIEILDSKGVVWEIKLNASNGDFIELEKD